MITTPATHVMHMLDRVVSEPDPDDLADTLDPSPELAITMSIPRVELEGAATRLRSDPALEKALARLLEGGWSYTDDEDAGLAVRFDPRSKGRGKKAPSAYTTRENSCTCPGAAIRGACYHPLAWQIVSEALHPTTSLQLTVPYAVLIPLCLMVLSSGAEQVVLTAETEHTTMTLSVTGCVTGTIHVEMTCAVLLTIEHHLRAADLRRVIDAIVAAVPPDLDAVLLDLAPTSCVLMAGPADDPLFFDGVDALDPAESDHSRS